MLKGEFEKKRILDEKYILLVSEFAKDENIQLTSKIPAKELEDLVPIALAAGALREYAKSLIQLETTEIDQLTAQACENELSDSVGLFDALQIVAKKVAGQDAHIDKVAYTRTLLDVIKATRTDALDITSLKARFTALFSRLRKLQRQADKERSDIRLSHKLRRLFKGFQQDHPIASTKEDVTLLFENLEANLDTSDESEEVRSQVRKLSQQFEINDSPLEKIKDFSKFMESLENLRHRGRLVTQETDE